MTDLYPPGPPSPPADLAAPTARYRLHVAMALTGLAIFFGVYLGMMGWLLSIAWTAFLRMGAVGIFFAAPPIFVFLLLLGGLYAVRKGEDKTLVEVKEKDEPVLWAFVRRVADDAGAPRPHRLFLSPEVNAAVFYDLTFWNLLLPTRKNLRIGLGLINVMTLDQCKAVLAHEFGHFAQRSMGVSRYVYVAWQVIERVVGARTFLDSLLSFISRIDIRIAWIGWLMQILVWSVRALLDTLFRGVVVFERALSREMEFQADLVSVKLSGSDSLVHALFRLGAADEVWGRTLDFADGQVRAKKPPADFYAIQERLFARLRDVRDEPAYGLTPARPREGAEAHRVFPDDLAVPPQMWSTHPPNRDREENAKRRYLPSSLDDRSAWLLFADPLRTRRQMTEHVTRLVHGDGIGGVAAPDETLGAIDSMFAHPAMGSRYRGVYVGRSVVRDARKVEDLVPAVPAADAEQVRTGLAALYPESLVGRLRQWRDRVGERAMLQALKDGLLKAPGNVVRFRGRELDPRDLSKAIALVDRELQDDRNEIDGHDRAVRTAHQQAARLLGRGWPEHLQGLLALLHYADHVDADLGDAQGHLLHVLRVVTADGSVSNKERVRLVAAATDAWKPMSAIFAARHEVSVPADAVETLGGASWAERLPKEFGLNMPVSTNIGDWLKFYDGWQSAFRSAAGSLEMAALKALLTAEDHVAAALSDGTDPGDAPAAARVPAKYPTLPPGAERPRKDKLSWWDRFQLADGWGAGAARLGVAVGVLGIAFYGATSALRDVNVIVHNGLGIPIQASVGGGKWVHLEPGAHRSVSVAGHDDVRVRAKTEEGEGIEAFTVDLSHASWGGIVYNVAGASVLEHWTVLYGPGREVPPYVIGAPRWYAGGEDYVLVVPPESIESSSNSTTRTVLDALDAVSADDQMDVVADPTERTTLALAHLRWDPTDSPNFAVWADAGSRLGLPVTGILSRRDAEQPGDVPVGRFLGDHLGPEQRARWCLEQQARADAYGGNADAQYLALRCRPDSPERDAAFLELAERFPQSGWVLWSAAYTHALDGRWAQASQLLASAEAVLPLGEDMRLDGLRIHRMAALAAGQRYPVPSSKLTPWRATILEAEQNPELDRVQPGSQAPLMEAWLHLAVGEVDAAAAVALPADTQRQFLRVAAASDGAGPALLQRVRSLGGDGIDPFTAWAALALEARDGRPLPAEWVALTRSSKGEYTELLLPLLDRERLAKDPAFLDAQIVQQPMVARGLARLIGVIVLADKAPPAWRLEAKGLLFPWERPYLK